MMVCPNCRSEYRDGFTHCADCSSTLVIGPLASETLPEPPEVHLVSVFESGNPSLISLAKSLLDSAGIEYVTRGEGVQDLFGLGRFPASVNLITGPVVFQVHEDEATDAAALLSDLRSNVQSTGDCGDDSDDVG